MSHTGPHCLRVEPGSETNAILSRCGPGEGIALKAEAVAGINGLLILRALEVRRLKNVKSRDHLYHSL